MVFKYLQGIHIIKIQESLISVIIDIDKIRVSDKKLYNKQHNSYKHYVFFYENGNEYIPLKVTLLDVLGYYNIFKGNSKTMNFKLDDDSLEKILI